ncbi:3493_t:CDS:1 [Dentiscutata erythropus]|uniref:3493_t:CDS:1 n=1 Tax=Dentiscutata erythropus TaxID=1348616 RepID=A0A9N9GWQ5_9GLOM|nr:3493_t:CDS:1 [Dentiscutata erythropus]
MPSESPSSSYSCSIETLRTQMPSISEIEEFDIGELSKNKRKPLNAFMIYRNEFRKRALANGMKKKMSELSKMAGESWRTEPTKVKAAYTRVSRQIDKIFQRRREEQKIFKIVYDPKMGVPQEQEHDVAPHQSIPADDYMYSLNVDAIPIPYFCSDDIIW